MPGRKGLRLFVVYVRVQNVLYTPDVCSRLCTTEVLPPPVGVYCNLYANSVINLAGSCVMISHSSSRGAKTGCEWLP